MSPWAVLAGVLLLGGVGVAGDQFGYHRGVNAQKVVAQAEFDRIQAILDEQKTTANANYRALLNKNLETIVARDKFKTELEKVREENRRTTADLRNQYSTLGLRFAANQDPGRGDRSDGTGITSGYSASHPTATDCLVSDEVATALRSLVYDADTLRDDYRLLYEWAHRGEK